MGHAPGHAYAHTYAVHSPYTTTYRAFPYIDTQSYTHTDSEPNATNDTCTRCTSAEQHTLTCQWDSEEAALHARRLRLTTSISI